MYQVQSAKPTPAKRTKGVRLDLLLDDHVRLERCARKLGVTKAAYARMAVLRRIRANEARS